MSRKTIQDAFDFIGAQTQKNSITPTMVQQAEQAHLDESVLFEDVDSTLDTSSTHPVQNAAVATPIADHEQRLTALEQKTQYQSVQQYPDLATIQALGTWAEDVIYIAEDTMLAYVYDAATDTLQEISPIVDNTITLIFPRSLDDIFSLNLSEGLYFVNFWTYNADNHIYELSTYTLHWYVSTAADHLLEGVTGYAAAPHSSPASWDWHYYQTAQVDIQEGRNIKIDKDAVNNIFVINAKDTKQIMPDFAMWQKFAAKRTQRVLFTYADKLPFGVYGKRRIPPSGDSSAVRFQDSDHKLSPLEDFACEVARTQVNEDLAPDKRYVRIDLSKYPIYGSGEDYVLLFTVGAYQRTDNYMYYRFVEDDADLVDFENEGFTNEDYTQWNEYGSLPKNKQYGVEAVVLSSGDGQWLEIAVESQDVPEGLVVYMPVSDVADTSDLVDNKFYILTSDINCNWYFKPLHQRTVRCHYHKLQVELTRKPAGDDGWFVELKRGTWRNYYKPAFSKAGTTRHVQKIQNGVPVYDPDTGDPVYIYEGPGYELFDEHNEIVKPIAARCTTTKRPIQTNVTSDTLYGYGFHVHKFMRWRVFAFNGDDRQSCVSKIETIGLSRRVGCRNKAASRAGTLKHNSRFSYVDFYYCEYKKCKAHPRKNTFKGADYLPNVGTYRRKVFIKSIGLVYRVVVDSEQTGEVGLHLMKFIEEKAPLRICF